MRNRRRRGLSVLLAVLLAAALPVSGYGLQQDPERSATDAGMAQHLRTQDPEQGATDADMAQLLRTQDPEQGATDADIAQLLRTPGLGQAAGSAALRQEDYDGYLCVLKEDAGAVQIDEMENRIEELEDPSTVEELVSDAIYRADTLEDIRQVADPDMIDYIEPDYRIYPLYTSGPLDHYNAAIYRTIGITPVWEAEVTGKKTPSPVTVAVMDTGVAGWSDTSKRHEDLDYSKFPYALKSSRFSSYDDTVGHGTFVIGEIAAKINNEFGITGLMPDVQIVPVKVLSSSGGSTSDVIAAMKQLLKKGNIDVVNMSFGSPYYSAALSSLCKKASAKGMILVASVGNNGTKQFYYPAAYDNVVGVSAVAGNGARWKHSEYNDSVDIAAPGVGVVGLSYMSPRAYTRMSGTSMSAPMVTALAAMVKSIAPQVKHNQFLRILKAASTDKGKKGYDTVYGLGIINFQKVYTYMKAGGRGTAPKTGKLKPAKAKIKSVKMKKKSLKFKAKKLKKATSYQIAMKVKGGKYYYIRNASRVCTITGLSRKTRYYIKVRGVRNVDGVNYYGKWSKVKKVRTK